MRYQVGQVIPAIGISYNAEREGPYVFYPYFPWAAVQGIKEIKIVELTVTEHHKVSSEWDEKDSKDCDGYILKDSAGTVWYNQYPTAAYGQISCESDSRFDMSFADQGINFDEWASKNKESFCELKSLASYITSLKRGLIERAEFLEKENLSESDSVEQAKYTKQLEDHLADVIAKYEAAFDKRVVISPLTVKNAAGEVVRTIPKFFRVTFEPKV